MKELLYSDPDLLPRLWAQMELQVKSYHRHYHMGENSSVPTEIARELLESMVYTVTQAPEETLEAGQAVLAEKLDRAKALHRLVSATAPDWEGQYRWETTAVLGTYLQHYDLLHFAHRIPEDLDYPLLVRLPEGVRGIDHALAFLNCLWQENQILHALGDAARGSWEQRIPDYWGIPLNLCEQPLIQVLGRHLLGKAPDSSELTEADRRALLPRLRNMTKGALETEAEALCRALSIEDPNAASYACQIAAQLHPRLRAAISHGDLSHVFL